MYIKRYHCLPVRLSFYCVKNLSDVLATSPTLRFSLPGNRLSAEGRVVRKILIDKGAVDKKLSTKRPDTCSLPLSSLLFIHLLSLLLLYLQGSWFRPTFLSNHIVEGYPSVAGLVRIRKTPPFCDRGSLPQRGRVHRISTNHAGEGDLSTT